MDAVDYLLDYLVKSINFATTQVHLCTDERKKEALKMIHEALRNNLFDFYGHIGWFQSSEINIVINNDHGNEMQKAKTPISVFDKKAYCNHMQRALILDVWISGEIYFRNGNNNDSIKSILKTKFNNAIPASINILRCLRNSYHNNTIYYGKGEDQHVIEQFNNVSFEFTEGKKLEYFHPSHIFPLIDDVILQIQNSKDRER